MAKKTKEELQREYIAREEAELERLRENARRLQAEEAEAKKKKDAFRFFLFFKVLLPLTLFAALVIYVLGYFKSCSADPVKEPKEVVQEVTQAVSDVAEAVVDEVVVGEEGEFRYITESTLSEVVSTAVLYTASYPYNGFVASRGTDGRSRYYVAYKGEVKAGIDFDKVKVSLDEETDKITVVIPRLRPLEITIDSELDFMEMEEKLNTEGVYAEAYKMAEEDLKRRMETDDSIRQAAIESAKTAELALLKPWVEQVDPERDYTIEVLYEGETEP